MLPLAFVATQHLSIFHIALGEDHKIVAGVLQHSARRSRLEDGHPAVSEVGALPGERVSAFGLGQTEARTLVELQGALFNHAAQQRYTEEWLDILGEK